MEKLLAEVRSVAAPVLRRSEDALPPGLDLVEAGLLDSLRSMHLANDLERRFDVRIPQDEIGSWTTLRAITAGIHRLRQSKSPRASRT
ncbi:MAG: acyl carrier protein [Planctomycetes bacterium]|nr:acyl carrier protein [Planctomycetota bacterium]